MTRGLLTKGVLVALVTMASVDAAQGGLIFGRRNRCDNGGGYGYVSSGYANSGPMYSNGYAYGGPMNGGYATGNTTSAYADPNLAIVQFDLAAGDTVGANKGRMRVHMPSNDARLWINNQQAQFSGMDRAIDVTLNPSQATKYMLTAQWFKDGTEVVRKKEVELLPGQETKIIFGDMDTGSTQQIDQNRNGNPPPTNPPINPSGEQRRNSP